MNFPAQIFESKDITTLGTLVLLEALLSADNALILAIMVRHLKPDERKRALFYGLAGAFVLRLLAIVGASWISALWWVQLIGAAYLVYLPIKHFIKQGSGAHHKGKEGASFWMTVVYADLADLAFAVDSVLVAVAIEPHKQKIWVVYAGAVIGIILLRYAATWCLNLLQRYPVLDHMAYVLVGWAGVKLAFLGLHTYEAYSKGKDMFQLPFHVPELPQPIFWGVLALIVIGGIIMARMNPAEPLVEEETAEE